MKDTLILCLGMIVFLLFLLGGIAILPNRNEQMQDQFYEVMSRYNDSIILLNNRIDQLNSTIDSMRFDWDLFKTAIIKVESNNNPKAVNSKSGAIGLYQILPEGKNGYLDYYNKNNDNNFSDADLYDPGVQDTIFEYIQSIKNPEKSFISALKLHNPRSSIAYVEKVINEYSYLKGLN